MPLLLSCPQTPNPSNERTSYSRLRQHKNWKNLKIYFLGSFSFSLTSGWLYYNAAGCRRQRGAADRCFHLATVVVLWSELSAADNHTDRFGYNYQPRLPDRGAISDRRSRTTTGACRPL